MFKNPNCSNCKIIRYFLLAVFIIVLIGLIQKDKLHYLSYVTPKNAAILILVGGTFIFIGKVLKHMSNKKKKN